MLFMNELSMLEKMYIELADKLQECRRMYVFWSRFLDYDLDLACTNITYYDNMCKVLKRDILELREKILEEKRRKGMKPQLVKVE